MDMSINTSPVSIVEIAASSAAAFWELLSPEKPLFPPPSQLDASKNLANSPPF
jgi:hypothetical protein